MSFLVRFAALAFVAWVILYLLFEDDVWLTFSAQARRHRAAIRALRKKVRQRR